MRADNVIWFVAGSALTFLATKYVMPRLNMGEMRYNWKMSHPHFNKPKLEYVTIDGRLMAKYTDQMGNVHYYPANRPLNFRYTDIRSNF